MELSFRLRGFFIYKGGAGMIGEGRASGRGKMNKHYKNFMRRCLFGRPGRMKFYVFFQVFTVGASRRRLKKARSSSRDSSARTPAVTVGRWL